MKKKLLFFVIIALALTSCNFKSKSGNFKKQAKTDTLITETVIDSINAPKKITEFLTSIDTSKIVSFNDYYALKQNLFNEYYELKQKAFSEYYDKKNQAFSDYYDKEQGSLKVIREQHYSKYLEWLDAEKIGNYQKLTDIEASPEFAEYISFKNNEYSKYKEKEKSLYSAYQEIEKGSYKEYQEKESLAYKIYQKRSNN